MKKDKKKPIKTEAEIKLDKLREAGKKLLIAGYQLNPYPNRRSRRNYAKKIGDLRKREDGANRWPMYKSDVNVQTFIKEQAHAV